MDADEAQAAGELRRERSGAGRQHETAGTAETDLNPSFPIAATSAVAREAALAGSGTPPVRRWRHRFACLHVVSTFGLLIAGASVTSRDAGLTVADWPTSFHFWNPVTVHLRGLVDGLAFVEHFHREVAMAIGLLTIVLAAWLWRTAERRAVRVLGVLLLAAVLLQGLLGGLTVLFRLPAAISIGHGLLAQTFFCLSIATAYVVSREWSEAGPAVPPMPPADRSEPSPARDAGPARGAGVLRRPALLAAGAVWVQLLLGAIVRHTVAKEREPRFLDAPVLVHALFAAIVLIAVGRLAARAGALPSADRRLTAPAFGAGILLMVQLALGLAAVASGTDPVITVLHVIAGATILGLCLLIVLRSFRLAERSS